MAAVPHKRRLHVMVHVRRDTIARRGRHLQNKMRVHRVHPVRRGLMRLLIVRVMRDMVVMRLVGLRVRHVHVDITRAVQETWRVPRQPQDTMQPGRVIQVRPRPVPAVMPPQVRVSKPCVQWGRPVPRVRMQLPIVHVMRDMVVMRLVDLRVQNVRRDTINPVRVIHHVQKCRRIAMHQGQGQPLRAQVHARQIHPVRRGLIRAKTVHVMRDMAVMPEHLRVQFVRRDTINPVRVIHRALCAVQDITVPVVRIVQIVQQVHTVHQIMKPRLHVRLNARQVHIQPVDRVHVQSVQINRQTRPIPVQRVIHLRRAHGRVIPDFKKTAQVPRARQKLILVPLDNILVGQVV